MSPGSSTPTNPARPSALAALGWTVAFLGGGLVLTVVFATGFLAALGGFERGRIIALERGTWGPLVAQTAAGLLVFGTLTWMIGIKALRFGPGELRWTGPMTGWKGFLRGVAIGAAAALITLLLSAALGGARLREEPGNGGVGAYLAGLGQLLLLLVPAALLEEMMFRGVPQVLLARVVGRWPAVALIAVAFALVHLGNPNTTPLGLVNIGLAGVLLGLAFYLPGGIWSAWGAHLGWNAALAGADAPVSGLPSRLPFLDYSPGAPTWLTGGAFGPEGGLTASLALIAVIGGMAGWLRKEA